jgi:hypothetical protein
MRCEGTNSRWWQLFRYQDGYLVNERGTVIGVTGEDMENQMAVKTNKKDAPGMKWRVVYVEDYSEPKKGELNTDFGLFVQRDFYIVSALPSGRYIDLINNRNMVIKTSNGRRSQVWYFHQQSLTIRTRYNNQSWDIESNGRSSNMRIWSTNS